MSKSLITNLRKLGRKKHRLTKRQFIAEGLRTVSQIIENKRIKIDYLVFDEKARLWNEPVFSNQGSNITAIRISHQEFIDLSDTDTPQGVIAVCHMPNPVTVNHYQRQEGCLVALNRIQDPGNAGTIIRTATWFGATGILCDEGTVDIFHPKVVRSTAGASGSLHWWVGDLERALSELEFWDWKTYLLDAGEQSIPLQSVSFGIKTILVVGNEATGLDSVLKKSDRNIIRIPGSSERTSVESLNASVSLSIALYELFR